MTNPDGNEAVAATIVSLNELALDYMLVGSYSSNVYGIPRATADADFVVAFGNQAFEVLATRLGPEFKLHRQIEFELITGTIRRSVEFLPRSFQIELFKLSDDPFDQSRFKRRVRLYSELFKCDVWIPSAEDVIVQKLRWGRRQDLSDVSDILTVQHDSLDWDYIHQWTREHGTAEDLQQIVRDS